MSEQRLNYHELPKDYLEPVSQEEFEANSNRSGIKAVLPLGVVGVGIAMTDYMLTNAEAPKDMPNPEKAVAVIAAAGLLTYAGTKVADRVKAWRKNRQQDPQSEATYTNEVL